MTVSDFPVKAGNLSADAIARLAALIAPPRATVEPVAPKSRVVETVMPVADAATGPPIVAPVRVMVMAPAPTSAVVATVISVGTVPPVVVAQPVPVAPMVPLMYPAGKAMVTN